MQKRYTRIPRPFARLGTKGVVDFYQLVTAGMYAISIQKTDDDLRYNTACEYVIKEGNDLHPGMTRIGYYNRVNISTIVNIVNMGNNTKVLEEVIHHPIDKEKMVRILNHHYSTDLTVDDFDLTFIAGNEYLITALPDSIGYFGEGIIQIGMKDKDSDDLIPIHHAYIMSNDQDVTSGKNVSVNGRVLDASSPTFFKETGLIYQAFGSGLFKSVVLINTKDTPMKVVLPNNRFVAAPENVNQSVRPRDETIILTPLTTQTHRLPSEPLVMDANFTAVTWLENHVELDSVFIVKVNDDLTTFEELLVGKHGVIARVEDGKLKIDNKNYFPVKVSILAKTDSIQASNVKANRFISFNNEPDLTSQYEYYYLTLSARERIKPTINITHYMPETKQEYLTLLEKVEGQIGATPVVKVDEDGLITEITSLNLEHSAFEQYRDNISIQGDTKFITLKLQEDGLKYIDLYKIDEEAWEKIKNLSPDDVIFTIRSTDLNGKDERGETYTVNHLLQMMVEVEDGAVIIFTRTINQSAINTFVFSQLVLNDEREVTFKSVVKGGNKFKPAVTIDVGSPNDDGVIEITPTIDEIRLNRKEVTANLSFNLPSQFLAINDYLSKHGEGFDTSTMFEADIRFGKTNRTFRFNYHDYKRMVENSTPFTVSISDVIEVVNTSNPAAAKESSLELSISVNCDADGAFSQLMETHQDITNTTYRFHAGAIGYPTLSLPENYAELPDAVLDISEMTKQQAINNKSLTYYRLDEERPYAIVPPKTGKHSWVFEYSVNPEIEELYRNGSLDFRFVSEKNNIDITSYNEFLNKLNVVEGKRYVVLNVDLDNESDGSPLTVSLSKQLTDGAGLKTNELTVRTFTGKQHPEPTSELFKGDYRSALSIYARHLGNIDADDRFFKLSKAEGVMPVTQNVDDSAFIATVKYRRDIEHNVRVNVPITVNIPTLADVERFKETQETVLTINGEEYSGAEITNNLMVKDDRLMLVGGVEIKGQEIIDKQLSFVWNFPYQWNKESPMMPGFSNTTDKVVLTINQVVETLDMPNLVAHEASETYSKTFNELPVKLQNRLLDLIPQDNYVINEAGITVRKTNNNTKLSFIIFGLDTEESKAINDIRTAMTIDNGEFNTKVELTIDGDTKVITGDDVVLNEEGDKLELYIPIELPSETNTVTVSGTVTVYPDTKPNSYFIPKATEFTRTFNVFKAYPAIDCINSSNVGELMTLDKEYRLIVRNKELMSGDINAISSYLNSHLDVTFREKKVEPPVTTLPNEENHERVDESNRDTESRTTGGPSSTDTESEERPGERGTSETTGGARGEGEGTSGEDRETGDDRDGTTIAEIPPSDSTGREEEVSGETRPETTTEGEQESGRGSSEGESEGDAQEDGADDSSGAGRGANGNVESTPESGGSTDGRNSGDQTVDAVEPPPPSPEHNLLPPAKRYIGTVLVIKNNRASDERVGAFIDNQVDLSASGLTDIKPEGSSIDVTTWRNHTDEPIVLRNIAGTWSSDNSSFIVSDFTSVANGTHHNHHEASDAEEFIILPTVGGAAYTENAYNVGLRTETAIYSDEDNRFNLAEASNVEKIVLTTSDGEAVRFLANAVNVGEIHTTDFFSHRELTRTEDGSFTPSEGDGDYNWYRYRTDSNSLTINYSGTTNRIYTLSYGSKLEATNSVEVKYRVGGEMKSVFVSRLNPSFKMVMH